MLWLIIIMHLIPKTSTLKWGCFSWIVPNLYHWESGWKKSHVVSCFQCCRGSVTKKQILKLTCFSGKPSWWKSWGNWQNPSLFEKTPQGSMYISYCWWFRNLKQPAGMVLKTCKSWDKLPSSTGFLAGVCVFRLKTTVLPSRKALESSQLKQPHLNWWMFRVPGYDIDLI